jgi:hypothetical protein
MALRIRPNVDRFAACDGRAHRHSRVLSSSVPLKRIMSTASNANSCCLHRRQVRSIKAMFIENWNKSRQSPAAA